MAGCCSHEHHEHDTKTEDLGTLYTLYTRIDLEKVQCLNESVEESGKVVFKPWDQRLDTTQVHLMNELPFSEDNLLDAIFLGNGGKRTYSLISLQTLVESDCDEELLFNIPFTGSVKLKGIIVIGGEDNFHPSKMRLFKNRPHMTFDDATGQADQEIDLQPDHTGSLEYTPKIARFSNTEHLSIHFPTNFGEETTKVYYIGLKGDFMQAHKHGVTICTYESKPNPADHSVKEFNPSSHSVQ